MKTGFYSRKNVRSVKKTSTAQISTQVKTQSIVLSLASGNSFKLGACTGINRGRGKLSIDTHKWGEGWIYVLHVKTQFIVLSLALADTFNIRRMHMY